jgi:hypothetical protein
MKYRSVTHGGVVPNLETWPETAWGLPSDVLPEFPAPNASTGTVDDDDEPEDEHDGENEASERKTDDDTEAPEEFQHDENAV